MKIILAAGARPNFMKVAPLVRAIEEHNASVPSGGYGIDFLLVHTGQHYDVNMSDSFFEDLKLPQPHIHLDVGSGTHAEQTGRIMIEFKKVLLRENPELVGSSRRCEFDTGRSFSSGKTKHSCSSCGSRFEKL